MEVGVAGVAGVVVVDVSTLVLDFCASSNPVFENLPVPELLNMHSSLTRSNPPVLVCGVSWEIGGS